MFPGSRFLSSIGQRLASIPWLATIMVRLQLPVAKYRYHSHETFRPGTLIINTFAPENDRFCLDM